MADCSTCQQFGANAAGAIVACPNAGSDILLSTAATGQKQHPLLYLIYTAIPKLAAPTGRKVRATWRAPTIRKNGTRYYPPATINASKETKEISELVGMLLAQSVNALPLWALCSRSDQEKLATRIHALLYVGDEALDHVESFSVDSLMRQFQGVAQEGEESLTCRGVIERIQHWIVFLQSQVSDTTLMAHAAQSQIAALRAGAQRNTEDKPHYLAGFAAQCAGQMLILEQQAQPIIQERDRLNGRIAAHQQELQRLQAQYHAVPALEALLVADEAQRVHQSLAQVTGQRNLLNEQIAGHQQEHENWRRMTLAEYEKDRDDTIARQLEQAGQLEREMLPRLSSQQQRNTLLTAQIGHCQTLLKEWLIRAEGARQSDAKVAAQQRNDILAHAIGDDFALQKANYVPTAQSWVDVLTSALGQGHVAKQIFLSLHPRLKYRWKAPTICRMGKLLSDPEFLATWDALDKAALIAPGPHARLGVFVMNALTPGSYDQRHREMVQWELDELVKAMREYGVGDRITCHSCGAAQFGDVAKSGWIRDHNPPTALLPAAGAIGLKLHGANGANGKQILLPQCMACSTQQSNIVNRVAAMFKEAGFLSAVAGKAPAQVRGAILTRLTAEDRDLFVRLVLNPGIGWSTEGQTGNPKAIGWDADGKARVKHNADALNPKLITSGGPGSFAGIDDDLLSALGDQYGCHTCVDVPQQTNAYRGISWIADHQPPTSLVARGLAELPQLVYPHCHKCSKEQSQLTRKLVRIFDNCFGGTWADRWVDTIKTLDHDDVA